MPKPRSFYFDNNATTPVDPAVFAAMRPFFADDFANPSSPYSPGRSAAAAVARARELVAGLVNAQADEIIFTGGGTESNNSALHSALRTRPDRDHIITSKAEHSSVLNFCKLLEARGHRVTFLGVDGQGRVDLEELGAALTDQTALVSLMAANNETGVIGPVSKASDLAHARGAFFHTDAVQAAGKVPLDLKKSSADFVSLGAHKIHGPKGIGALYIRQGTPFLPYHVGGDQEYGRRAGTENVPAVAGFGAAADLARTHLPEMQTRVRALRDTFEDRVSSLAHTTVVSREVERLPNTSQLLIGGIESDALIARLDMDGICCSSGSACAAGAHEPSHVLRAMGLPAGQEWGALRVSFGRYSTADGLDYLVDRLLHSVQVLRRAT